MTHHKEGAKFTQPVSADRAVDDITSRTAAGSHIPLVVRRCHGDYSSLSAATTYGRNDRDRTGQLSDAGELYQRDPAVSSALGSRH